MRRCDWTRASELTSCSIRKQVDHPSSEGGTTQKYALRVITNFDSFKDRAEKGKLMRLKFLLKASQTE